VIGSFLIYFVISDVVLQRESRIWDFGLVAYVASKGSPRQAFTSSMLSTTLSWTNSSEAGARLSLRHSLGFLNYSDEQWTKMLHQSDELMDRQRARRKRNEKAKSMKSWGRVGLGYDPALHCEFERRFGIPNDGGKWVCDAYRIAELKTCNIVSIGSNNDWSFETMMHHLSPHCKIHTFDHTIKPYRKPDFVKWWPFGISDRDEGQLVTISTALEKCGLAGQKIDIFKIDCEGCEYAVFNNTDLKKLQLQQILIELHAVARYKHKEGMYDITPTSIDEFFDFMARNDYMIFHKEDWSEGCCAEYSFIRIDRT